MIVGISSSKSNKQFYYEIKFIELVATIQSKLSLEDSYQFQRVFREGEYVMVREGRRISEGEGRKENI